MITSKGNSFWVRHRITPVTARYLTIRVQGMSEGMSKFYKADLQPCMRFEVYGCAKPGTTEPPIGKPCFNFLEVATF